MRASVSTAYEGCRRQEKETDAAEEYDLGRSRGMPRARSHCSRREVSDEERRDGRKSTHDELRDDTERSRDTEEDGVEAGGEGAVRISLAREVEYEEGRRTSGW